MGGMPCHVTNHVKHDHKDEVAILDQIIIDGIMNKNGLHLFWINLCSRVKLITHALKHMDKLIICVKRDNKSNFFSWMKLRTWKKPAI
jgi:hypothetical protein